MKCSKYLYLQQNISQPHSTQITNLSSSSNLKLCIFQWMHLFTRISFYILGISNKYCQIIVQCKIPLQYSLLMCEFIRKLKITNMNSIISVNIHFNTMIFKHSSNIHLYFLYYYLHCMLHIHSRPDYQKSLLTFTIIK